MYLLPTHTHTLAHTYALARTRAYTHTDEFNYVWLLFSRTISCYRGATWRRCPGLRRAKDHGFHPCSHDLRDPESQPTTPVTSSDPAVIVSGMDNVVDESHDWLETVKPAHRRIRIAIIVLDILLLINGKL